MNAVYIDIKDIRELFKSDSKALTGNYSFTDNDFKSWLYAAIDFLGLVYVDFQWCSNNAEGFRPAVSSFNALNELYAELVDLLKHPVLDGREISTCQGYVLGDILCFHVEFLDE